MSWQSILDKVLHSLLNCTTIAAGQLLASDLIMVKL